MDNEDKLMFTVIDYDGFMDDDTSIQLVVSPAFTELYRVYDLTQCPEDAIIGRSLFSAWDYIDAVRYGFELARTTEASGIAVQTKEVDSYEEFERCERKLDSLFLNE